MSAPEKKKTLNRKTNAERAEKTAALGMLHHCEMVNEEGLSLLLQIPVATLQKCRKELPRYYPLARMKADMEAGVYVTPPYTMIGGSVMYIMRIVRMWMDLLPLTGWLPPDELEKEGA